MATTALQPETWTHELKRRAGSLWVLKMLATLGGIAIFLYASLWVYVSLGSTLAKDGRELAAWAALSFAMVVVGLGIFMALPTKVPDFAIDWSRCPSLHAAFSVFTAVVLHTQLTAIRAPRALLACNALWCLGIVYSAMATRQH